MVSIHGADNGRIDFSNEVTVLVGTDEKKFTAHKDVLCETSDFFRAALGGAWLESADKIIRLPDQVSVAFSIYLNWRYCGSIDLWDGREGITTYTNIEGQERQSQGPRYERLVHSYALGDFLKDQKLCNALVNAYFEVQSVTNSWPLPSFVNLAFECLPETSKLRLLIVHHIAFSSTYESFEANIGALKPEVVAQIALVSVKYRSKPAKTTIAQGRCFYHEHENDEGKCTPGEAK